jgi:hypothetical protein
MATIAVFLALGGGAYAALKLPKNSVGRKQLKRNSVNSAKVKDGSLKILDFAAGQLPAGQRGPTGETGQMGLRGLQGERGETGATGPSDVYQVTNFSCPSIGCPSPISVEVTVPAGDYAATAYGQVLNLRFDASTPPPAPPDGMTECTLSGAGSVSYKWTVPGTGFTTVIGSGGAVEGATTPTLTTSFHLPSGGTITAECHDAPGNSSPFLAYDRLAVQATRVGALHP